jgi:hypothetical protein
MCLNRLRKVQQIEEKASFRGSFVPQDKLKSIEYTQFASASFEPQDELKHGRPEEKDFFRSLLSRAATLAG